MDLGTPYDSYVRVWAIQDSNLDANKSGSNLQEIRDIRPYDKNGKQHRSDPFSEIRLRKSTEDDGTSVGVRFLSHGFPSALRPALVEPTHIELHCENTDTPGEP